MAAVEVAQVPGHEVAAAVRAGGHLEVWPRGPAVGVEHSTPNTCASGCIVPQAIVHCGLEVGRLTGRLASSVPPRHVRRRVSRGPRNGVLVMAHEPLTRSGGPRYVKEHRGVLVVALQSVAFGASPRRVPAGEAV